MKTAGLLAFLLVCLASPNAAVSETTPPSIENMVLVPGGEFTFGFDPKNKLSSFMSNSTSSQNAQPSQKTTLPSFYIDKFEVTYGDFLQFKPKAIYAEGRVDHPVRGVSWYEAEAYCFWLGKRLPTEFEWEKAARGQDGRPFVWGSEFDRKKANFGKAVKRIGSFPEDVTLSGSLDMNGNVSEWTASEYKGYPDSTYKDPDFDRGLKVIRGGAYNKREHGFLEIFATLSFRNPAPPTLRSWDTGFRCAKSATSKN